MAASCESANGVGMVKLHQIKIQPGLFPCEALMLFSLMLRLQDQLYRISIEA